MIICKSVEELNMNTLPVNTIINGECVSEMKKLPDSCIDLIIADPPYNLSKGG
ncbi:MAG: site-specific DNA-methyltransferase, partial [Firmicutes bacterium]|nr:site-specific DNA-methyltransferase [Bacillota bacterium]